MAERKFLLLLIPFIKTVKNMGDDSIYVKGIIADIAGYTHDEESLAFASGMTADWHLN